MKFPSRNADKKISYFSPVHPLFYKVHYIVLYNIVALLVMAQGNIVGIT
jgi:hypothetical protein